MAEPRQLEETASIEARAAEIDAAMAAVAALPEEQQAPLRRAFEALDALHADALRAVVRRLKEDPRGKELLFELVDDPAVHMVLAMHGIVRAPADPPAPPAPPRAEPFIPLTSLGIGPPDGHAPEPGAEPGWFQTFPVERVAPGSLEAMSLRPADGGEATEVIVVNAAGRLTAYVNACAHQGLPLDTAIVDGTEGTLTCPWHGFCYDTVEGECLTMPGATLEQLPLRVVDGHIWVRATADV